jgi:hypothetical protein
MWWNYLIIFTLALDLNCLILLPTFALFWLPWTSLPLMDPFGALLLCSVWKILREWWSHLCALYIQIHKSKRCTNHGGAFLYWLEHFLSCVCVWGKFNLFLWYYVPSWKVWWVWFICWNLSLLLGVGYLIPCFMVTFLDEINLWACLFGLSIMLIGFA